jgi:hypothetical protein
MFQIAELNQLLSVKKELKSATNILLYFLSTNFFLRFLRGNLNFASCRVPRRSASFRPERRGTSRAAEEAAPKRRQHSPFYRAKRFYRPQGIHHAKRFRFLNP